MDFYCCSRNFTYTLFPCVKIKQIPCHSFSQSRNPFIFHFQSDLLGKWGLQKPIFLVYVCLCFSKSLPPNCYSNISVTSSQTYREGLKDIRDLQQAWVQYSLEALYGGKKVAFWPANKELSGHSGFLKSRFAAE